MLGANGAGKSTWVRAHRDELPVPFFDADAIAQSMGDYNDSVAQRTARAMVDAGVARSIERRESFGFESTYSGQSRPAMVSAAHAAGYRAEVVFLGTPTAAINKERVAARVDAETGHGVPDEEVERRWTASQENLVATAHLFDSVRLIDNTGGVDHTLVVFDGERVDGSSATLPRWGAQLSKRIAVARSATHYGVSEGGPRLSDFPCHGP